MKLRREWGPRGSYHVTIPRDKIAFLGWHEGDDLSVDCDGKKIVITRIPKQLTGEDADED